MDVTQTEGRQPHEDGSEAALSVYKPGTPRFVRGSQKLEEARKGSKAFQREQGLLTP